MKEYSFLNEDCLTPLKSAVGAEAFEGKAELARETLCSNCTKRTVCRYVGDFEKLLHQTDRLERQVHIHRVDVSCSEFEKTKTGFREEYPVRERKHTIINNPLEGEDN